MRTSDFDYYLPPELIAQEPVAQRDQSRLLVVRRAGGALEHRHFCDLPHYLRPGDVLVLNDSRVIPARLRGENARSGGEFEILLLEENGPNDWWVLMRPGRRARVGTEIVLLPREDARPTGVGTGISLPARGDARPTARVVEVRQDGQRRLVFDGVTNILGALDRLGEVPLPPYIQRAAPNLRADDKQRYQTVFAQMDGSVAAPTAGLHFTQTLLDQVREMGVTVCQVTLHVGLGTFAPVKADRLENHVMHEERFQISHETADVINLAKAAGRRVVAVGTTTVRVLETAARGTRDEGRGTSLPSHFPPRTSDLAPRTSYVQAGEGRTRLFLHPPCPFRIIDALVTNFHLPCSTLLMLVCAFAAPGETGGRGRILGAYAEAIRERYRFFSYGDAMVIL